ncbi:MAG: NUDIX domain-containing protein [Paludibacteraceae bacterium]|nr:NUDIX domain-containing protein [Paludibacteraceae bacterium]
MFPINKYCSVCGSPLVLKPCIGETELVPFCETCNEYRFPKFNVAVCTAIFNKDKTKVLMMRQYGREKFNFLAGYINIGETAEDALPREMMEEMHIKPSSVRFLYTYYFAKTNTLMVNFLTTVDSEDLSGMSTSEVDEARWFTFSEAIAHVIPGGGAEKLLKFVEHEFVL